MQFKYPRVLPASSSFNAVIRASLWAENHDEAIQFVHRRAPSTGRNSPFEITSSRPMSEMTARVFDREFPCFSDSEGLNWTGLVGIDIETKPGRYPVKLIGIDRNKTAVGSQTALAVLPKKFPTRRLTVEEKYVTPAPDALVRIQKERERVNAIFASITPEKHWNGFFVPPVPGSVISVFGKRNIYNGQQRSPHTGVDFRGSTGTPIKAPNAGRIVLAAELFYSGNTIIVDHGLGLYSYFGHLSALTVKEGDQVKRNDVIGRVGSTGLATGPHLHWTVRLVETRIDPLSLLKILHPGKT
jgi:hypothetical protein